MKPTTTRPTPSLTPIYWGHNYNDLSDLADLYTAYTCSDERDLCALDAAEFHVHATDNNCHAHLWWKDRNGKHHSIRRSTGLLGYKGAKRGTAEAAQTLLRSVSQHALDRSIKNVHLFLNGMGQGRGVANSVIERQGLRILSLNDTTPLPHGGCRGKTLRRV